MRLRYILCLPVLHLIGCSAGNPIREWQQRLTEYTARQGNGDITILRDSAELRSPDALRPAQIRFDDQNVSASGMGFLDDRLDTRGVLVGQYEKGGVPTFFFLVGVVKRPYGSSPALTLQDIRLISCGVDHRHYRWDFSDENPAAVQRYLSRRSAIGGAPGGSRGVFPQLDDDFRFDIQSGYAVVSESASGAQWRLSLH